MYYFLGCRAADGFSLSAERPFCVCVFLLYFSLAVVSVLILTLIILFSVYHDFVKKHAGRNGFFLRLSESPRSGIHAYLAQDWFPKYSMTMIPVRIVQSSSQSSLSARPGLQAGNVVNARVLYDMGGGQYAISLAGQKIAVRSQTALEPGSVFAAKIIVKGEQVLLSLVGQEEARPLVTQFTSAQVQEHFSPQLAALLASLGLPPETDSFHLLQFAQAMGMKLDPQKLRRALAAGRNAGDGEESAQTALVMEEKGLEPNSVQAVSDCMGGNAEHGRRGQQERQEQNENETQINAGERRLDADENPDGSIRVHSCPSASENPGNLVRGYFASVDEAASENEMGALTLFNSLRGGADSGEISGWLLFPFEWKDDYRGIIRILPEKNQKKVREIIINAKNPHTNWNFVVYCKQGKVDSVLFSRNPAFSDGDAMAQTLKELLLPAFGSLRSVACVADLDGWCAQDEAVGTVGGLV